MINHSFNQVPTQRLPRSVFNRPSTHKFTFDHGKLYPWFVDEVIPGDSHKLDIAAFTRLATPLFPIMDNIRLDFYGFFCPSRILWNNFEKQQGAQDDPGDSIDYNTPQVDVSTHTTESITDYFGIPVGPSAKSNSVLVNALPYRMYNEVYNTWFRDQNLVNSLTVEKGDGPDTIGNYSIQKVAKLHDYFTSAMTSPQKGNAIDLPLGTTAPIYGIAQDTQVFNTTDTTPRDLELTTSELKASGTPSANANLRWSTDSNEIGLVADLTNATAATINSLREAFALQRLLERDMTGGSRYVEILKSRFGVTSPDFRLQRPEFLFHHRINLNTTPIAQQSEAGTTPQGHLAGIGVAGGNDFGFSQSFVEHGYIMLFVCARADLTYQEGIERMWGKRTRYDMYTPELANIGEQEIYNYELFYTDESSGLTGTNNAGTFGYTPRYEEYRFKQSKIMGQFRSSAITTFDPWHLSQEFSSLPSLNQTFIEENAPMNRIKATSTDPDYIIDTFVQLKSARPMPLFGVPGMGGKF